jgi:hypothetical protein
MCVRGASLRAAPRVGNQVVVAHLFVVAVRHARVGVAATAACCLLNNEARRVGRGLCLKLDADAIVTTMPMLMLDPAPMLGPMLRCSMPS